MSESTENEAALRQISAKHFEEYLQDDSNIVCPYQSSEVGEVANGIEAFFAKSSILPLEVRDTVSRLLSDANENDCLTFMDFGCGDGRLLHELHRRTGMRCLGLDVSEDLVRFASSENGREARVTFACVDCTKVDDVLRFAENVGMVYVYMVHGGLRRLRAALEALARRNDYRTVFVTNDYHVNVRDERRGGEFLEWSNWRCLASEGVLRFHVVVRDDES